MGGEKAVVWERVRDHFGSPPRGRGKAAFFATICVIVKDHPRVGGEKRGCQLVGIRGRGSPPRGRGKAAEKVKVSFDEGITPAWAGKSHGIRTTPTKKRDHPRVGGEKLSGK